MMRDLHMKLLAGVAILGLSTSLALAGDYSQTTTQRSSDAYGNSVERTDSVQQNQSAVPGGSQTTETRTHSTTMNPAPGMVVVNPGADDADVDVAASPYPPSSYPPPAPPASYQERTTTRTLDNGGVQTDTSKSVETNQAYIDEDGQLSAHTTTRTDTHSTTVSPPSQVIPPPMPAPDMPPNSVTTTTTTTRVGQ